jgi:hypothetical protein
MSEMPSMVLIGGMHVETIESFHESLLDIHCKGIERGKEQTEPAFYVLTTSGEIAIISGSSFADMGDAALFQQHLVKEPLVRACAIVSEAWVAARTKEQNETMKDVRPKDDPNRTEAVVVSILTAGRQALTISPIRRPANIVERAPFQWLDEAKYKSGGRMVR